MWYTIWSRLHSLVKRKLSINVRICFWTLSSPPLIYVLLFYAGTALPWKFELCAKFRNKEGWALHCVLSSYLFIFGTWVPWISIWILESACQLSNFDMDSTELVGQFGGALPSQQQYMFKSMKAGCLSTYLGLFKFLSAIFCSLWFTNLALLLLNLLPSV